MKYTLIPPCKELNGLVKHFWTATWNAEQGQDNTRHIVVANSSTEITFAFSGHHDHSELLFSAVQGHTHLPGQFVVPVFYHLIGVSFHSHAVPFLFNVSPSELGNEFISLTTLLGADGVMLNEKVALARNTQERIDILSTYFISASKGRRLEDTLILQSVNEIKQLGGNIRIEALASQFGLSKKQFGRRFKNNLGFNPKLFARIVRFESVLASHPGAQSLTETAYANGYFDQAHFTHELKTFTGFKPKDFWNLGGDNG